MSQDILSEPNNDEKLPVICFVEFANELRKALPHGAMYALESCNGSSSKTSPERLAVQWLQHPGGILYIDDKFRLIFVRPDGSRGSYTATELLSLAKEKGGNLSQEINFFPHKQCFSVPEFHKFWKTLHYSNSQPSEDTIRKYCQDKDKMYPGWQAEKRHEKWIIFPEKTELSRSLDGDWFAPMVHLYSYMHQEDNDAAAWVSNFLDTCNRNEFEQTPLSREILKLFPLYKRAAEQNEHMEFRITFSGAKVEIAPITRKILAHSYGSFAPFFVLWLFLVRKEAISVIIKEDINRLLLSYLKRRIFVLRGTEEGRASINNQQKEYWLSDHGTAAKTAKFLKESLERSRHELAKEALEAFTDRCLHCLREVEIGHFYCDQKHENSHQKLLAQYIKNLAQEKDAQSILEKIDKRIDGFLKG